MAASLPDYEKGLNLFEFESHLNHTQKSQHETCIDVQFVHIPRNLFDDLRILSRISHKSCMPRVLLNNKKYLSAVRGRIIITPCCEPVWIHGIGT